LIRRGKKNEAQLVLLDHGLYEELPLKVRQSLCRLWSSIVRNDHYGMKQHATELGVVGQYIISYYWFTTYIFSKDPSLRKGGLTCFTIRLPSVLHGHVPAMGFGPALAHRTGRRQSSL